VKPTDDLQSAKARVWVSAQKRGWAATDLAEDYSATNDGAKLADADVDALTAYAVQLEMAS
jgi:hypothetical protein